MEEDLIRAIAVLNTRLRHALDRRLRPLGLSEVNYYYLLVISEQPGINQAALINRVARDQSSVTRQVDRLTRQGWLKKERSATDARQSALFLTPKAEQLLPQLWQLTEEVNAAALSGLSAAERATLLQLLDRSYRGLAE